MNEIKDKMKQIERKQEHAAELRKQLARSLAIAELWPGVFSADADVKVQWRDDKGVTLTVKRTVPLPSNMKTEERVFPLKEIPECLRETLPAVLVARLHEYERKQMVMRRLKGEVTPPC